MFQQTVLSVSYSDTPSETTTRWGENNNEPKETTYSGHSKEGESDSEKDYEEWKEDPWYHQRESQDSEQHAEPKREEDGNTEEERASLTELTSNPEEKESSSTDEQDANQSSSVDPTWGQWRQKTEQELSDEWKVESVGRDKPKPNNSILPSWTLPALLCDKPKPVSTTNLNPREELTCFECKQLIAEHEGQ
jgi:hypothetical protein